MKVFQKLKKWVAGLTVALLLANIFAPTSALANNGAESVTVTPLSTTDTTPTLTGTFNGETVTTVTVTVNDNEYATILDKGRWTADITAKLAPGTYDVLAQTSGAATNLSTDELVIVEDLVEPKLTTIKTYSNNAKAEWAKVGDRVFVELVGSEELDEPIVTIGGSPAIVVKTIDGYKASRLMTEADVEGRVSYSIAYSDLAGNVGEAIENATSAVTFDKSAPTLLSVSAYKESLKTAVATETPLKNFLTDEGVVLSDNNEADITSTWEILPKEGSDIATYKVTYLATDMAGNISVPVGLTVRLGRDELVDDPTLQKLTLNGKDTVTWERGVRYEDAGAHIVLNGEAAHIWAFGDLNLAKVDEYKLGYYTDKADSTPLPALEEAPIVTERAISVEDTVGPDAVTGLKVFSGNGYVQLSWVRPINDDLAGFTIYRSSIAGERGAAVAMALLANTNSFDDYTVVNGETYYYTVVAFDDASNNSLASVQVSANPKAPKVVAATDSYYQEAPQVIESQDVKSDETENKLEVEDQSNVPVLGIIILVLLIILGIYLLYLQNPHWFNWVMFWKREKAKAKNKKK